jgi:hypothetical protein
MERVGLEDVAQELMALGKKYKYTDMGMMAVGILALARAIENKKTITEDDSHHLCLGIRHALFGVSTGPHSTILDLKSDLE